MNWPYKVPCGIIDTMSVRVSQPEEHSWEYWTGKNTYTLKYEVVCAIGQPRIIWLSGPWKGNASDSTIASESGIKICLEGEALLADKIYKGDLVSFIVPQTGAYASLCADSKAYNFVVYSARQTVEWVIKRLKDFGMFNMRWRMSSLLHWKCTISCGKLTNLFLIFEPLG